MHLTEPAPASPESSPSPRPTVGATAFPLSSRLCPNLIGILKTLLAIRSGTGVSNATSKFRRTIVSSRAGRSGSDGGTSRNNEPTFPETEEEEVEDGEHAERDGPPGADHAVSACVANHEPNVAICTFATIGYCRSFRNEMGGGRTREQDETPS